MQSNHARTTKLTTQAKTAPWNMYQTECSWGIIPNYLQ